MIHQSAHLVNHRLRSVPFVEVLLPYTERLLAEIDSEVPLRLVDKLHATLLSNMSFVAEVTLQEELDQFIISGQRSYQRFVAETIVSLESKYPVLDEILKNIASNYLNHIQNICTNLRKDWLQLAAVFSLEASAYSGIRDIDTSLGDGHHGEGTALITLVDGTKLIYKPRNIDTALAYNSFLSWVNHKLGTNLKTIKCISCGSYGWLAFIPNEGVDTPEELSMYYYQAGILLAVTLLLGSKDCHFENVIASGKYPVIIDHETIIQPVLSKQSVRTWDEQHQIPYCSILESMLIVNRDRGVPLAFAGYGIKGKTEAMELVKQVVHANSIDSKRSNHFLSRKLVKENIPTYEGQYVFANDYKHNLISGFSAAYDMFMASREELFAEDSPILAFANQNVRYVWRPTYVYFRILKYLRKASFMGSFASYRSKLYELIAKAYQKGNMEDYRFILAYEIDQLLKGDIPLFNVNSSKHHLLGNETIQTFQYDCIENIKNRISLFSPEHKGEQIEYITNWLRIPLLP
ncbi:type 2 lanthipeptide synthetase LanM [Haliscomenobacter hydrossis]|uniref:Lantibiotic biosynthesis protein dehydration domain-containing protein n=1 Tax=Haliscomenobacter hydrossis (strain ATCC 27775 / DSM 1100 / LMG 10767 / O) TaxID=760192 RepID=F4L1P1_HALH1|nr:type 2 lanthipeptide synthetase LanM [Haliscomenobacter hydrossis]AEE48585.1 hypothetical protein Halhy_0677 [Haliscomenobacter hydrossis DSM 1100]